MHSSVHMPVLVEEVVRLLDPHPGEILLDATVGGGGHAQALLQRAGGDLTVLGLDPDPAAIAAAGETLQAFRSRVHLVRGSYLDARTIIDQELGLEKRANRILLDLGVSSIELEESGRGFSFHRTKEPLDMRFDPRGGGPTAADLLATGSEQELVRWFTEYGEEPSARKIARAIIRTRKETPLATVSDLVGVVASATHGRHRGRVTRLHPATRTFQALRIAVNRELEILEEALPQLIDLLLPGGRIAVISFHSLEDRIVKTIFKREATDCLCPPSFPECRCGHVAQLTLLTKHVVTPTEQESTINPRSRSAKLRVAEKLLPS